jgi:hypothetical protein
MKIAEYGHAESALQCQRELFQVPPGSPTRGRGGPSHGILEGEARNDGMIAINAHYDGRFIIPDEPVDLPPNQALIVRIEAKNVDKSPAGESALVWLAANASESTDLPSDLSHQHDHYLYGVPKRGA